jgi:hypothetical protein
MGKLVRHVVQGTVNMKKVDDSELTGSRFGLEMQGCAAPLFATSNDVRLHTPKLDLGPDDDVSVLTVSRTHALTHWLAGCCLDDPACVFKFGRLIAGCVLTKSSSALGDSADHLPTSTP